MGYGMALTEIFNVAKPVRSNADISRVAKPPRLGGVVMRTTGEQHERRNLRPDCGACERAQQDYAELGARDGRLGCACTATSPFLSIRPRQTTSWLTRPWTTLKRKGENFGSPLQA